MTLLFVKKSTMYRILTSLLSVAIAISFGAVVSGLIGGNIPLTMYSLFISPFTTFYSLQSTFNLAPVLLLTGEASAFAFIGGVWNFGMEGQLYIGALMGVIPVFILPIPSVLVLPLALIFGALGGSGYALIAAFLKVKLQVTEIVSTMLLNFIAPLIVDYATQTVVPLHSSTSYGTNSTPTIPSIFQMKPIGGSPIGIGFVIALIAPIIILFLVKRTKLGFELRVMGGNSSAAKYAGIPASRNLVLTMLISGALSGLAGCFLVFGVTFALFNGISNFYGWLGVPIALLSLLNPLAVIFSSFFFALLNTGSITMRSVAGVPSEVALMIEAIIVIVALLRPWLERRLLTHVA